MIDTHLTRKFGLLYPIISDPIPGVADGELASAISQAGALGVVGAGPCDRDWIRKQFKNAGEISVACGLYSLRLEGEPEMLDYVLSFHPRAIYLSNGDPRPHAERIRDHPCRLICEARSIADFDNILEAGADVLVIKEGSRDGADVSEPVFSQVPKASDYLHKHNDDIVLVASGGVTDARGLAAMIALGADGVCLGQFFFQPKGFQHADGPVSPTHETPAVKALRIRTLLQTINVRAERIMSHLPRKIVKEPPGPGATGELGQGFILDHRSLPLQKADTESDRSED
ncbi:MAG: nitronate monooxygenase [Pseudomonadota bacterium]